MRRTRFRFLKIRARYDLARFGLSAPAVTVLGVLHRRRLLDTDGVRVTEVRCDGTGEVWSEPEPADSFGVVLVRAGLFRRRCEGVEVVVDATTGYVQRAGLVERMAHPRGGDLCTSITLDARLLDSVLDGRAVPAGPVLTTPRLDLAHRTLVARAGQGADPFEITERTLGVVAGALAPPAPRTPTARRAGTEARRRRLVDHSRQVLDHDCGIGLVDLARALAVSPHHLSRVFAEATGLTLSAYRARLRTRRALERLAAGEADLAGLAADLGFCDQAHLTRTVRAQTGMPPGRLRRLLGPPA